MEVTSQEKTNRQEQEEITTGIVFDLKILLSTIKGKTIFMMNKASLNQDCQADFNEMVNLVEESIIRTEFISIPRANIRALPWEPVRICD